MDAPLQNVITKKASPGKYPEQSRASLHLTDESHVKSFEAAFLAITFHDAKGTYKDQNLKGLPPTLGFSPIQRIPSGKPRIDGRQGTIDQDLEYMAFLESETQPVPKPQALDTAGAEKTRETITTTPLIEALREKKANKEKAKAAKSAKRDDAKDDKVEKSGGKKGARGAEVKSKAKTESVARDAPKPVKPAAKSAASAAAATSETSSPSATPAPNKRRERAPANIKSMLQRDLGLNESPRRGGKQTAVSADATTADAASNAPVTSAEPIQNASGRNGRGKKNRDTPATETVNDQAGQAAPIQTAPTAAAAGKASAQQNQQRAVPKAKAEASGASAVNATQTSKPQAAKASNSRQPKSSPQPSPGSTRAYLKHANASQGITEPLLKAALSTFGEITALEIDKRKGTALATFKDHESFKAAMAKRSIPVAQGAVEVLEFRDKPAAPAANRGTPAARTGGNAAGGGGGGRGRGRGAGRGGTTAASESSSPGSATIPAAPTPAPATPATVTGDAT